MCDLGRSRRRWLVFGVALVLIARRRAAGHEVPERPAEHQPTSSDPRHARGDGSRAEGPAHGGQRPQIIHGGRDRGRRPLSHGLVEPNLTRSSKSASACNPCVGRFDSYAAPLTKSLQKPVSELGVGLPRSRVAVGGDRTGEEASQPGGCFQTCKRRTRHSFCATTAPDSRNATPTSFGLLPQARRRAAWHRDFRPFRAGGEPRRWTMADRARPFGEWVCAGRPDLVPAALLGPAQGSDPSLSRSETGSVKGVAVGMESSSWDGEIIVVSGGSASYLEASGLSRSQMAGIPLLPV